MSVRYVGFPRLIPALVALALFAAADARAAAGEDPFFNSSLSALCESGELSGVQVCTAYLSGFAEGYIWNSANRCDAPSADAFREAYLREMRRDPSLRRDPSGNVLFALMERLTTTHCAVRPKRRDAK